MKKLFLLSILLLSLISCSSETESETDSVVERGGLYYEKFSEIPFTGKVAGEDIEGRLKQGRLKDGMKEGKWVEYWNNGKLMRKGSYKKGVMVGEWKWREYWHNGQLMRKGSYKNGMKVGEWVGYDYNGRVNKRETGTFKYGEKVSD